MDRRRERRIHRIPQADLRDIGAEARHQADSAEVMSRRYQPEARGSRIAVVIATRNRADELATTLVRLQQLPEVGEIVVVDNASTDDTWECLRTDFPYVTSLRMPVNLGAAARTVGATAVDAPYVAFCDDDSWWEAGSLSMAADVLDAHPRLAVVAAQLTIHPTGRSDPLNAAMATGLPRAADVPGVPVLGFVACAAIVRRSGFLSAGGFHSRWQIGGEELPLALDLAAAGWQLAYIEDIRAVHNPSQRRDPHARRRTIARNDAWCAWTRRSMRGGLRRTAELLRSGVSDRAVRQGLLDAVRGVIPMLSERRPVPVEVERQLSSLDAQRRRIEGILGTRRSGLSQARALPLVESGKPPDTHPLGWRPGPAGEDCAD
jgi:N-acetylglucosaminyl-diphospho-decaprenol L-rhamnosyltransferase